MYKHFYEELYKRKTWTKITMMNANNHAIFYTKNEIWERQKV